MKIRITPGALLLLFVMLITRDLLFCATLIAAAVHECGHLLAARRLGIKLRLLELDLPGARLFPAGAIPSYRAEGILAAAGPAASLALAAFLYPLRYELAAAITAAALSQGLFNLLPVSGFDGGRILCATLAPLLGERLTARILWGSSYLCVFFLFSFSATLLLRHGGSLSLTVLSASLFTRIFLFEGAPPSAPYTK